MQWHWGNIGSGAAGLGTLIAALFAVYGIVRYGPAWLRDSRERQQAQAAAARAQERLAGEQAEQIRLDRRRYLHGWSGHGIDTFGVALVTSADERATAREELTGGGPTGYVILRVAEGENGVRREPRPLAAADHRDRGRPLPAARLRRARGAGGRAEGNGHPEGSLRIARLREGYITRQLPEEHPPILSDRRAPGAGPRRRLGAPTSATA